MRQQSVGLEAANALATVLGKTMRTRMITTHGNRKRLTAKNHDFYFDVVVCCRDDSDGLGGNFDRQHNACGIVADKKITAAFVKDIDKRADDVGLVLQSLKTG